jgi:predicted ATPase
MIDSIRLQDFKGHRDTTVPLGRFTALVGPNGSGKTSVLEALRLQSQLVDMPISQLTVPVWPGAEVRRQGATGPIMLKSKGHDDDTGPEWNLELAIDVLVTTTIKLKWNQKEDTVNGLPLSAGVPEIKSALRSAVLYKLSAQSIAAAAYTTAPMPRVAPDGTNTSEVLVALKLGNDEKFERIEEEMRLVVPNIERVRIRQSMVGGGNSKGSKVYFDFHGAPGVPAHHASEGTLIALAILTILHSPERPGVLLLDDFDQSLHPRAQMELVRLIKRLLAEIDDLQIVATTHSPYVLDELDPSEIHAFALRADGTVASKRLSEHPEAERMKGSLTTGQLWTLDPEQEWVAGERTP